MSLHNGDSDISETDNMYVYVCLYVVCVCDGAGYEEQDLSVRAFL